MRRIRWTPLIGNHLATRWLPIDVLTRHNRDAGLSTNVERLDVVEDSALTVHGEQSAQSRIQVGFRQIHCFKIHLVNWIPDCRLGLIISRHTERASR